MVDRPVVALVTGANRGLGRETARQLAGKGITVLLGSRDPQRGAAVAAEIVAEGGDAVAVPLDVTDEDSVAAVAAQVRDVWSKLDVLVNNAGAFRPATAVETTAAPMRDIFEVNVFGVVTVTRAVLALLARSPAPRIVNVSSTTASLALTSAGEALPGNAAVRMAYTASKATLNMLTVQYARAFQLDPELARIKINSATPGYTATDMNQHQGILSVHDGARAIVELATLPADGPTGGFFDDEGPVPW